MELFDLRTEIDSIDNALVRLFEERMLVAEKIAAYKRHNGLPIFVPMRETQKIEDVTCKISEKYQKDIQVLYKALFELSRNHQHRISDDTRAISIDTNEDTLCIQMIIDRDTDGLFKTFTRFQTIGVDVQKMNMHINPDDSAKYTLCIEIQAPSSSEEYCMLYSALDELCEKYIISGTHSEVTK